MHETNQIDALTIQQRYAASPLLSVELGRRSFIRRDSGTWTITYYHSVTSDIATSRSMANGGCDNNIGTGSLWKAFLCDKYGLSLLLEYRIWMRSRHCALITRNTVFQRDVFIPVNQIAENDCRASTGHLFEFMVISAVVFLGLEPSRAACWYRLLFWVFPVSSPAPFSMSRHWDRMDTVKNIWDMVSSSGQLCRH